VDELHGALRIPDRQIAVLARLESARARTQRKGVGRRPRHSDHAFLRAQPEEYRAEIHRGEQRGERRCARVAIGGECDLHAMPAQQIDRGDTALPHEIEGAWQQYGCCPRARKGRGARRIEILQMIGRDRAEARAEFGTVLVRELIGMQFDGKASSRGRLEHGACLDGREADTLAKYIHRVRQSLRGDGRDHLGTDAPHVLVAASCELGRHRVSAEERRFQREGAQARELVRGTQLFALVFEREPISRFDLNGGHTLGEQGIEARERCSNQLGLLGRPGRSHRRENAAARARDCLVGGTGKALRMFLGAVAGVNEVGVAVDEAGRDETSFEIGLLVSAPVTWQLGIRPDEHDASLSRRDRPALDQTEPRPTRRQGRDSRSTPEPIASHAHMIWCSAMIGSLFCDAALLPEGWRPRVRILISAGVIETVTPDAALEPGDERAAIVVPGMPNVHSHAFQRAMAGLAERRGPQGTDDFWSWRELMYRFLERIEPDELQAIAAYAYADMLEAGFTSVGEFHYLHRTPSGGLYADPAELALRQLAAADATGIGLTLLPVFYEASGFGGAPPTAAQRRFVTDLDAFAEIVARVRDAMGGERATQCGAARAVGIAPHSLRAVTPGALRSLLRLYPRDRVHIHAAEQPKEVSECIAWSGRRPVEWLLENAPLDGRWCIVHGTHVVPSEVAALAASGAVAGLCPLTEANLGDGVFPAIEYQAEGGRWAIGSDANICLDAAGELRQLEYSQRLLRGVRNALAASERSSTGRCLFEAAAAGGAHALGLSIGAIAPRHRADFVLLDDSHPDLEGRSGDALLDTWIFSGGRTMIRDVIAGGERIVKQGRHRDRERLSAAYRKAASRLTG